MAIATPVAFETVPLETRLRPAALVSREWLTGAYVRLRVEGEALCGFSAPGADDHVRLFLVPDGTQAPASPEGWRELPSREYTPVHADPEAGWVEFDLVVHGAGPGSQWAARAPLGARLAVAGPRRSTAVTTEPDAWFLAGDETAVPAISRFLRARRPGTPARVIVEVGPENDLVPIPADAGTELTVLVRGKDALADVLAGLDVQDRPRGRVLGFVAAEAALVDVARALLLDRWCLDPAATIVKGYWRRS